MAGRHGAPGTLLGLLLSVLLPVVAWGLPSFEPFMDATASGGTAYTAGSGLYHQTNALGESWSLWNGGSGSTVAQVMCVSSNLTRLRGLEGETLRNPLEINAARSKVGTTIR
jgi:hypothetical protein